MYSNYYGFSRKPFELTPDPDVIYLSDTHLEAISVLRYGVLNRKGFLQLTGKVGTGKSTLVQNLIQSLKNDIHLCYIPNPNFTILEFYYYIAAKFGLDEFDGNKAKFIINLSDFLKKCSEQNELALMIIDESHVLSLELLEEIRLLSNQEYTEFGVLSIFFIGQPEFIALLENPKLLPLKNRIGISFHIEPLTLDETTAYILYRLHKAGRRTVLFSQNAYREIHQATGGIPRTINILCDNALLEGFTEQRGIIDEAIIKECAKELKQVDKKQSSAVDKLLQASEQKEEQIPPVQTKDAPAIKSRSTFAMKTAWGFFAVFIAISTLLATSQYWGRLPAAAPARDWLELHVNNGIFMPLKNWLVTLKDKAAVFSEENEQQGESIKKNQDKSNPVSEKKQNEVPDNDSMTATSHSPEKIITDTEIEGKQRDTKNDPGLEKQIYSSQNAIPANNEVDSALEKIEIIRRPDGTNFVIFTKPADSGDENDSTALQEPAANIDSVSHVSITAQVEWANIRTGPSMDQNILRSVPAGYPLLVLDRLEKWFMVEDFLKRKGWIAKNLLVENYTVILKTDSETLRNGPSDSESTLGEISYGDIMQVLQKQGNWLKIMNKDGMVGWLQEQSTWPSG